MNVLGQRTVVSVECETQFSKLEGREDKICNNVKNLFVVGHLTALVLGLAGSWVSQPARFPIHYPGKLSGTALASLPNAVCSKEWPTHNLPNL